MNLSELLKNRGWSEKLTRLASRYIPKREQERITSALENGEVENG